LESLEIVKVFGKMGISVLSFDFSGSGMSDGDYVTLGVNESEDVKEVVDYAF
jgi:alpha/beta superfamily hydrolase